LTHFADVYRVKRPTAGSVGLFVAPAHLIACGAIDMSQRQALENLATTVDLGRPGLDPHEGLRLKRPAPWSRTVPHRSRSSTLA
jgi:hypothetical protein